MILVCLSHDYNLNTTEMVLTSEIIYYTEKHHCWYCVISSPPSCMPVSVPAALVALIEPYDWGSLAVSMVPYDCARVSDADNPPVVDCVPVRTLATNC